MTLCIIILCYISPSTNLNITKKPLYNHFKHHINSWLIVFIIFVNSENICGHHGIELKQNVLPTPFFILKLIYFGLRSSCVEALMLSCKDSGYFRLAGLGFRCIFILSGCIVRRCHLWPLYWSSQQYALQQSIRSLANRQELQLISVRSVTSATPFFCTRTGRDHSIDHKRIRNRPLHLPCTYFESNFKQRVEVRGMRAGILCQVLRQCVTARKPRSLLRRAIKPSINPNSK